MRIVLFSIFILIGNQFTFAQDSNPPPRPKPGKSSPHTLSVQEMNIIIDRASKKVFDDMQKKQSQFAADAPVQFNAETQDTYLQKANALIVDYQKVGDGKEALYNLGRMQVLMTHVHPVPYFPASQSYIMAQQLAGITVPRGSLRHSTETLNSMGELFSYFDPTRYSEDKRATISQAKRILKMLGDFYMGNEGMRSYQILMAQKGDNFHIRKSIKNGVYHLDKEFMKFIPAIALVRFTTCYGSSFAGAMGSLMTMQSPSGIRNSPKDPACAEEIGEMLVDPIFYIGFSAFVLGSRASTAAMNKAFLAYNPAYDPIGSSRARFLVPNAALAFGFLSDHLVKTIIQNKELHECASSLTFKEAPQQEKDLDVQALANATGQDMVGIDYFATQSAKAQSACGRAYNFFSSKQFLMEELGMNAASLLTTAALTGQGTKLFVSAKNLTPLKNLSFGFTAGGGPAGVVVGGIVHMTFFLLINNVVTPAFTWAYHEYFTQNSVDLYQNLFVGRYQDIDPTKQEPLKLNSAKKCSKHYAGVDDGGAGPTCTRIPLIAEIKSFHDYARTWRTKKVLGEFYMNHSRWQKKLTSFINNYASSMEQVQLLARSREIFLTGDSEFEAAYIEKRQQEVKDLLPDNVPTIDSSEIYQKIAQDAFRQMIEDDYRSPYFDMPLDRWERKVFNRAYDIIDRHQLLTYHKEGDPFYGMQGEPAEVITDILTFIDLGPINLQISYWTDYYRQQVISLVDILGLDGVYKTYPFELEGIKGLLLSNDLARVSKGIALFKSWMPYMYGTLDPLNNQVNIERDMPYNPQQMTGEQIDLFAKIKAALEQFDPDQPNEFIFTKSTRENLGPTEATDMDTQRSSRNKGFTTDTLAEYTLTQMICGYNEGIFNRWFGDNDGFSLEFPFPHLLNSNMCDNLYFTYFNENQSRPSPLQSIFATKEGFMSGLHSTYIQAPNDPSNPLLFNTEEEASQWWNSTIKVDSLERLKHMQDDFNVMVIHSFNSVLTRENAKDYVSWSDLFQHILPGGNKDFQADLDAADKMVSTETLVESMQNELYHYLQAVRRYIPYGLKMKQAAERLPVCLGELVKSIPGKNYKTAESQCVADLTYVKDTLRSGTYLDLQKLENLDESTLEDSPETSETLKKRVLLELERKIEGLFIEAQMYNDLVNESFKFNLEEGEIQ